jgi:predicted RNase H-like HicB family nuclease
MSGSTIRKKVQHYLELDYPVEVIGREKRGVVVGHPDLPGCIAQGKTEEEAIERLKEGREAWFRVTLELGLQIPLPNSTLPEVKVKEPSPEWKKDFEVPVVKTINSLCRASAT